MCSITWVYRVIDIARYSDSDRFLSIDETTLNEAGEDGWELVAIESTEGIFKRRSDWRQSVASGE